ncbi:MAG TPA: acyltransferase [Puia sp.]|nr:acyltransferase [Puia sp.]
MPIKINGLQGGAAQQSGQIEIITLLRGIAATLVFLFHLVCVSGGYISGATLHSVFFYGKYGVQFFFVISGFVIPYSMMKAGYQLRDFPRFFQKRIIRIEPPYLCVVFLTVCFLYFRSVFGFDRGSMELPTWPQILLHIGYLIPLSGYRWMSIVFWTLAIEFQFYLLFSLTFPLFVRGPWPRRGLYLVLIIASIVVPNGGFFFCWSPIFLMGIHTALFKMKKVNNLEYWVTIALLSAVVFHDLGWVTVIFAIIAVLAIYFEPQIRSRLLHFLGNVSYSLYLSHTLIAFAIINLGVRFTKNIYQKCFFVSLAVAATLLFSYLLYRFIEIPAKKWAAAIRYQHE